MSLVQEIQPSDLVYGPWSRAEYLGELQLVRLWEVTAWELNIAFPFWKVSLRGAMLNFGGGQQDDSMMEGSRQPTKTFHHGDWLPSPSV